jgi:site-specific DNA recombinase
MVNGELLPNETAPIVQRIFDLPARGLSCAIEAEVGLCYSTVRQIANNRVYTGMTRLGVAWHQGIHQPLVTQEQFDAAHRGHIKGRRRGRDLLTGRVRCGLCGRVVCLDYNERGQAIYRCKHPGRGCDQPGRSANGLHRAAQLGLRILSADTALQSAIRKELNRHLRPAKRSGPNRQSALRTLEANQRKLLKLHYADKITQDTFAAEDRRLSAQIGTLRREEAQIEAECQERDQLAQRFEAVAALFATIDIDEVWETATDAEKRVLIEDLVDAVTIFPG